MTISFPRVFPSHKNPVSVTFRSHKVVGVSTAPFSLVSQTQEFQGERWEGEVSLTAMVRADAAPWIAWLRSLRGPVGSFLLGDPSCATSRGSAAATPGTPQVDGIHAIRSRTLAIKTVRGNVTGYLKAADHIALGTGSSRRMYEVLQDVDLTSGDATIDIWPALRTSLADSATIYVAAATTLCMLVGATVEKVIDRTSMQKPATFGFVEDLRP